MATLLPAQFMTAPTGTAQPLTVEEKDLVNALGEQAQQILGQHGLGKTLMDGGILPPRFLDVGLSEDSRVAYFKIDVGPSSLPGKGAVAKA
ncbi:MAG: hypothetical protein JXA89_02740, partial [Anaerolineae bacterium]|nr:hypothetical protein [Anaerolineae bacterium]